MISCFFYFFSVYLYYLVKIMELFRYTGTFAGVPTDAIQQYNKTIGDNAELAQMGYDSVMNYYSNLQGVDDSEKQYLKQYGEKINQEISKIAKDSQGNIQWHTATNAVRNLARKVQSDEGINNIKNNFINYSAEKELERKLRVSGQTPLQFNHDDFQGVTYDENVKATFNKYGGFYETRGQWQEGYNDQVQELGYDNQLKLRNLYEKKDNGTLTEEEAKMFDTEINRFIGNDKDGTSETGQHYRWMMEKTGDDAKTRKHIIDNQIRHAVFSESPDEIKRNAEKRAWDRKVAETAMSNQPTYTAAVEPESIFNQIDYRLQPNQNVKELNTINSIAFNDKGMLSDKFKITISQSQFDKLSPEDKENYNPVSSSAGVGAAGTTVFESKEKVMRNKMSNQIDEYRKELQKAGVKTIDLGNDLAVYNAMQTANENKKNYKLQILPINDPEIKKTIDGRFNTDYFTSYLEKSDIVDINNPTNKVKLKEILNMGSSNKDGYEGKINSVESRGFGTFNKKSHNIDSGSMVVNINYTDKDGKTDNKEVVVRASQIDANFNKAFKPLEVMQDSFINNGISTTEDLTKGLDRNNKNNIKATELGFGSNANDVLHFVPYSGLNQDLTHNFKLKPVGTYNNKYKIYLDALNIVEGELRIDPRVAQSERNMITDILSKDGATDFYKQLVMDLQTHFQLGGRRDLEMTDGINFVKRKFQGETIFQKAPNTATMSKSELQ